MYYTTFSTPESLDALLKYLHDSPPKNIEDSLFRTRTKTNRKLQLYSLSRYFYRLNNLCGFGKPYRQSYLRSHSLRKLFATTLYCKNIQQTYVDFFLGHKINSVTESYFKSNSTSLKEQYINCIEDLSIEDVEVHTLQSPEFKKVTEELKASELRLQRLERYIEEKDKIDQIKKPE